MQEGQTKMNLFNVLLIPLLLLISAPFIIFFCSKWGAFGWFKGKELAENDKHTGSKGDGS